MADSILRLKVDSQEYDAKIKRASQGLQQYVDGCRKAGCTLEVVEKETLKFVHDLGKMDTVSRTAKGSLGELTKGFTDLSVQYKRLTDQEKASPFGKELKASLDQLKTRIMDSKNELQSIEKEIGGASLKGGDFSSMLGELGSKLGINSDLLGAVTTGTVGLTAAITAGSAAVAAAVKAWADYNTELAKQDQITTVTTGLKGGEADRVTDSLRAIASTYDVDFREAVNTANVLMAQFGETSDSALQLIRDGMQGMIHGDGAKMLSMIQQFAPSFRDAGVSASQLIAVVQNSEGGLFSEQNMNAILMGIKNIRLMTDSTSEALARLGIDGQEMTRKMNEGSMTVFEALQQVSVAIEGANASSKEAGAVMQQVFGRQGAMQGMKLGRAIAELNTNLEETKKQTGELGERLADLELAQEDLNRAMRETFQMGGWEEMGIEIQTYFIEKLANAVKGLDAVIDNLDKVKVAVYAMIPGLDAMTSAFDAVGAKGVSILGAIETAAKAATAPIAGLLYMLEAFGENAASPVIQEKIDERNRQLINAAGALGSFGSSIIKPKPITPIVLPKTGRGGKGGENKTTVQELTREQEIQKQIAALELEYTKATMERKIEIQETVIALDDELKKIKELKKEAHGDNREFIIKGNPNAQFLNTINTGALDKAISNIQDGLKRADFGSALAQSLQQNLVDANLFKNFFSIALKNGIDTSEFDTEGFWKKIMNGESIPNDVWESVYAEMSRQLGKPIELDFTSGSAKETEDKQITGKDFMQQANKLLGGLNQVAGGLTQMGIKLPEGVTKVLNIAQGLMTTIQGVQTVISVFSTSAENANTVATMGNTAAIYSLIPALYAAAASGWVPFAGGGIVPHAADGFFVPGNNFSGDRVHMALNSGELVLNAAQQGNLASQLTDNGGEISDVRPYTTGENIILGINAHFRRSGQGEIVTTSMLRRMGLI